MGWLGRWYHILVAFSWLLLTRPRIKTKTDSTLSSYQGHLVGSVSGKRREGWVKIHQNWQISCQHGNGAATISPQVSHLARNFYKCISSAWHSSCILSLLMILGTSWNILMMMLGSFVFVRWWNLTHSMNHHAWDWYQWLRKSWSLRKFKLLHQSLHAIPWFLSSSSVLPWVSLVKIWLRLLNSKQGVADLVCSDIFPCGDSDLNLKACKGVAGLNYTVKHSLEVSFQIVWFNDDPEWLMTQLKSKVVVFISINNGRSRSANDRGNFSKSAECRLPQLLEEPRWVGRPVGAGISSQQDTSVAPRAQSHTWRQTWLIWLKHLLWAAQLVSNLLWASALLSALHLRVMVSVRPLWMAWHYCLLNHSGLKHHFDGNDSHGQAMARLWQDYGYGLGSLYRAGYIVVSSGNLRGLLVILLLLVMNSRWYWYQRALQNLLTSEG